MYVPANEIELIVIIDVLNNIQNAYSGIHKQNTETHRTIFQKSAKLGKILGTTKYAGFHFIPTHVRICMCMPTQQ